MADLINRPAEFYVGFKIQHVNTSSLPLAFLTPFDTTAAFKKRKETVDSWARGYGTYVNGQLTYTPNPDPIQLKNEPVSGFKIAKSVKRTGGWNAGNVVWRIEDPRGFEWEIPSANLAQIITQTGIAAGGEINGKCIVARIGSTNILVPEGTDLWEQMEQDMQTRAKKATTKILTDIMPGDAITLKSGETGFYLGKRKVLIMVPDDRDMYAKHSAYQYQYYYKLGFRPEPSQHEYHLILVGLTDYDLNEKHYSVWAYKGNPPVVDVDYSKRISQTEVTSILTAKKCYLTFAGKAAEVTQEIKSVL